MSDFTQSEININQGCCSLFEMAQRSRKPGRPTIILPREAIISAYKDGVTIEELAEEFGVAYQTLRNRLHEWEVQVRHQGPILAKDRHRYARFAKTGNSAVDARRLQILELETKIAAGERNLKRAYDHKQAYEKELAILKGVPAR